ncbi:YebC/PmpR family DNA-binding transcriptional regulator, partial [Pantoea sp. SIMBA_072]
FMFSRVGAIYYPAAAAAADAVFEVALEAGAEDVASDENGHEVTTTVENFAVVRDALEAKFGGAESARLTWKPLNTVAPSEDAAASLLKLL